MGELIHLASTYEEYLEVAVQNELGGSKPGEHAIVLDWFSSQRRQYSEPVAKSR